MHEKCVRVQNGADARIILEAHSHVKLWGKGTKKVEKPPLLENLKYVIFSSKTRVPLSQNRD